MSIVLIQINTNAYKIHGEFTYFFYNKEKYLKSNKEDMRIRNYFTIPIIVGIFVGICECISFGIRYSILSGIIVSIITYVCLALLFNFLIKKSSIAKTIKKDANKKIIITKNGLKIESSYKLFIEWEEIELIGFTKNVLMICMKNSSTVVLVEPREEILNEIKKYTNAKVIIDK